VCQTSTGLDVWQVVRRVLYLRPGRLRWCVAVGSLVDAGPNLTGAWIVWSELLLKLVILCQYNSQIHRVPAGRIVTNKQTNMTNICPAYYFIQKSVFFPSILLYRWSQESGISQLLSPIPCGSLGANCTPQSTNNPIYKLPHKVIWLGANKKLF
jgi:hypothetical protein